MKTINIEILNALFFSGFESFETLAKYYPKALEMTQEELIKLLKSLAS